MITPLLIISLVSLFYGLFLYKLRMDFLKTRGKSIVNSQRDKVEKEVYRMESKLMEDSYNFVDTTKLLIKYAHHSPFRSQVPNFSFFQGMGIDYTTMTVEQRTVFCLMPFNTIYEALYKTIKSACNRTNIACIRSDEENEPGNLLKQIIEGIIKSQFIIAVLDGRNPNVFYEIGLCHAMGKPVFLLAHSKQKDSIPFDLAFSRLLLYSDLEDLECKLFDLLDHNLKSNG